MNFKKKSLGLLVLAAMSTIVLPAEAATKLENIKVNNSLASQTRIEFQFDGPVAGYQDRLQYSPERLVINLNDAESALQVNDLQIDTKGINDVKVAPNGANLDVTVSLDDLVPYEVTQSGNSLFVTLGQDPRVTAVQNGITSPKILNNSGDSIAAGINTINGINFKRSGNGDALIIVNLQNKNAALELIEKGTHLQAKFHGSDVLDDLLAVMDVADYATMVKSIDVSETVDGAVLDLALVSSEFSSKYTQSDESVVITVSKKKPVVKPDMKPVYSGKMLSLSFQDIPVRNALKILAEEIKINLVMNDSVQGNITVNFDGVPWDQALDTILRVKGLDKRLEGNILLVGGQQELADYEQKQLEEMQKLAAKEPLITEYIQVNYAKAADFVKLISTDDSETSISASDSNSYGSSNSMDSGESLLSSRGTVTVDERTNTIIIKDTERSIANIKRLIETLDTPIEQVVIEARIVTIEEGLSRELGVSWELGNNQGSAEYDGDELTYGTKGSKWFSAGQSNLASPSNPALALAKISENFALGLWISALESENKTEIIASPRVTTTSQKTAIIEKGYEIPSLTSASSGATTVEWKKAVLSLEVTPQITPDDSVFLDLTIKQDELGDTIRTATGEAISISTNTVNTQVLVGNGETLVLGGIFQQTIQRTVSQIPLLGDIPLVGWLFKSTKNSNNKREILIFVTPHIVRTQQ
jgi:type IV pilus assembly protein PilQ